MKYEVANIRIHKNSANVQTSLYNCTMKQIEKELAAAGWKINNTMLHPGKIGKIIEVYVEIA